MERRIAICFSPVKSDPVASLPPLGLWAPPPAEPDPSLESIYRVSLTDDLCEGNQIISLKNILPQPVGAPQKEKKIRGPWARAQCSAHWLRLPWSDQVYTLRPSRAMGCVCWHTLGRSWTVQQAAQ